MEMDTLTMHDYHTSCSPCADSPTGVEPTIEDDDDQLNATELASKPRYRKWVVLDKTRRLKASARERKRRHVLNSALERLRKKVPCFDQNPQKLSKIEILRQAIGYIADLSECLQSANSGGLMSAFGGPAMFLDDACMAEFGLNHESAFSSISSMLYGRSMLFDCEEQQDSPGVEECLSSPEPAHYGCYDTSSPEDFDYGINDAELDVYLRGYAQ